jgi:hypothetical protein
MILYSDAHTAYPDDHWALADGTRGEPWYVCTFESKDGVCIMWMVNPTDARGYRSILRLVTSVTTPCAHAYASADGMRGTLNRAFTLEEHQALGAARAVAIKVYEAIGLVAQVYIAGNKAHSLHKDSGTIVLGSTSEPLMLHGHVIGRGNSSQVYAEGLPPLGGPPLGEAFNFDPSAKSKHPWPSSSSAMIAFAQLAAKHVFAMPSHGCVSLARVRSML